MNFELLLKNAKEAKKLADENLAIAKFQYQLDTALASAKLLTPGVRRRIVCNMDVGYLIQAKSSVMANDWSAHADGDDKDIALLRSIGEKFLPLYLNIDK
jgi:hypothetical protein